MNDADRLHNPRVIAGTLAGFEGFQRFSSSVVDPVRSLLPVAVEVEHVAQELLQPTKERLAVLGFFVDDRDAERGRLRVAGPLDRFALLESAESDQAPGFGPLAAAIARAVERRFTDEFDLPLRGRSLRCGRRPLIMGVLNLTPDSFSDGGLYEDPHTAIERAFTMVEEGADLIDVGAESTRPGARPVPAAEEIKRLTPVLRVLTDRLPVPVSVDTMKPEVADRCLEMGVSILNDVSGMEFDRRTADVAARHGAALVINHMRGTPRTMLSGPRYEDPVAEITRTLRDRVEIARQAGVPESRVVLDPGIGFGKRVEDNLDLLAKIEELRSLGRPLLLGCSRKSFLGELTGRSVSDRAFATAATTAHAALRGVKMVRVHDIKETVEVLGVLEAIDERLRLA